MSADVKPDDFIAGYSVQLNEEQTNNLLETADMHGVPSAEFGPFALLFGLATLQRLWKCAPVKNAEPLEVIQWPDGTASKVVRHPNGNVSLVEMPTDDKGGNA